MTKDEALKMAIDDLELCNGAQTVEEIIIYTHDAIKACKEALAQPAKNIRESFNEILEDKVRYYKGKQPTQEPVAWMHRHAGEITEFNDFQACKYCEPLYTHPAPSWQGLSDDEVQKILSKISDDMYPWKEGMLGHLIARAIEEASKEKNT